MTSAFDPSTRKAMSSDRSTGPLPRPGVVAVVESPGATSRRLAAKTAAELRAAGVEVRLLRPPKQPNLAGVDLLVVCPNRAVWAAENALQNRTPLLVGDENDLPHLADDLDRLVVASHQTLMVRIGGRGSRVAVADCTIEPERPGVMQVEQDRARVMRRKVVLATSDPLGIQGRRQASRDRTSDVTIDQDDRGPTKLPPRSRVIVRPARAADRLRVSLDAGTYRAIATDVQVHTADRLLIARRDDTACTEAAAPATLT
jgi:hypothetical protein